VGVDRLLLYFRGPSLYFYQAACFFFSKFKPFYCFFREFRLLWSLHFSLEMSSAHPRENIVFVGGVSRKVRSGISFSGWGFFESSPSLSSFVFSLQWWV
jgi:hypothetical protein